MKTISSACKHLFHLVVLTATITSATVKAALVFDVETKLVPNVGARELLFGRDVAISDNAAAVSALLPPFNFHGGVYIYSLTGTNWVQTQILSEIKGTTIPDTFGASVAMNNSTLVVGQPSTSVSNLTGEVYIFTNSSSLWVLQQVLTENAAPGDGFGSAVDISGQTLAVGNPLESAGATHSGAVYIFQQSGGTWLQEAKLKATDSMANLFLGSAVAIDGDTVLAGALDAAYVLTRSGTNWTQQQKLTDPVIAAGAGFGTAIALEGNLAVVTAREAASNNPSGAAFVFVRTGTTWSLQQELIFGDNESNSIVSSSVAIHNGAIAVGLPNETVAGLVDAGTVQVYQFNGSNWLLNQEIAANDASSGAVLGNTIDFGGAGIIAGAPGVTDVGRAGQGAAYIFSATGTNLPVVPVATASPNVLFPPNHKMVPVTITISNHNSFSSCRITSVSSNEEPGKKGSPDFVITGDLTLLLRAERSGTNKAGRIYSIQISCTDANGAIASTTVPVSVPHDRGK